MQTRTQSRSRRLSFFVLLRRPTPTPTPSCICICMNEPRAPSFECQQAFFLIMKKVLVLIIYMRMTTVKKIYKRVLRLYASNEDQSQYSYRRVLRQSSSSPCAVRVLVREREEEGMHWAVSTRKKRRRFCFGLLSSGQVRAHGRTPQHSTAQPRFSLRFGARSSCRAFRSRLPSHLQREGRQQGRRGQGKGIKDGPACTDNLADAATHKNILLARSFDPARQASESPVWSRHG